MADPQQESRMADVVDALNETIDAIDRLELGDMDKHQAEEIFDFRDDLDTWRDTFRVKEREARNEFIDGEEGDA